MSPILVTGAAGNIGGVGRSIVEILCQQNLPVRALVHRFDERAETLRSLGAEVVKGDMTQGSDMARALEGCRRMYFGMSVSQPYLQATIAAAAAAKATTDFEIFVNISQMTVSQMSLHQFTDSPQQQQHWLAEQALNWSGLPVVHVRATVFLEHPFFSLWPASSIAKTGSIRLPFGNASTSPIAAFDVARVIASILATPTGHAGKIYELTGPVSQDLTAMAREYALALGREVVYEPMQLDEWYDQVLKPSGLPDHVVHHFLTMAKLHADNRYDRLTTDVSSLTGHSPMSVREFVATHTDLFAQCFGTARTPA